MAGITNSKIKQPWDIWLDIANTNKQGLPTSFTQYTANAMTALNYWQVIQESNKV